MSPSISPPHRYPSGDKIDAEPREEKRESVLAVAMFQRGRHGATIETVCDSQFGDHPLAWLRQWAIEARDDATGISNIQHRALVAYIKGRHRARAAEGFPMEHPKALDLDAIGGASLAQEMDAEKIHQLRRDHNAARSALLEYAQAGVNWITMVDMLARDEGPKEFWRRHLGDVRMAANVLVHHFGLLKSR